MPEINSLTYLQVKSVIIIQTENLKQTEQQIRVFLVLSLTWTNPTSVHIASIPSIFTNIYLTMGHFYVNNVQSLSAQPFPSESLALTGSVGTLPRADSNAKDIM